MDVCEKDVGLNPVNFVGFFGSDWLLPRVSSTLCMHLFGSCPDYLTNTTSAKVSRAGLH